jgi:hypothetical protein
MTKTFCDCCLKELGDKDHYEEKITVVNNGKLLIWPVDICNTCYMEVLRGASLHAVYEKINEGGVSTRFKNFDLRKTCEETK